jgi:DNA-binding PadR family transcriptional regulator
MTHRERILNKLSSAGLVDLEWRYTHHNAYIRTRITDKGIKLIQRIIGAKPKLSIA